MMLLACMLLIAVGCGKKGKKDQKTAEHQDENVHEEKLVMQQMSFKNRLANYPTQKFKFSTDSVSFIVAQKGTVIYVQPGNFIDENGKTVTGEVDLEVREVVTMQDFMKIGISTLAGDKMLETGGTFYIQASKDGKPLKINPKVGLGLAIPTVEKKPGMQLFYGEVIKDSLNPNGVNWVLANGPEKDPDDLDEPVAPKEMLDPLEGLEKNEASLRLEYERAEAFVKEIDRDYKLEGDKYVFVGGTGKKVTYEASYVNKLRRKLAALKGYKKFLDDKRNFYKKKNAALYEAWDRYYKSLDQYEQSIGKKPSFYELKLKESGPWFNCDKYVTSPNVATCKIIDSQNKRPMRWCRVHFLSKTEKIYISYYLEKSENGVLSIKYIKDVPFKLVIDRGKTTKEYEFDGTKTDLGELEI